MKTFIKRNIPLVFVLASAWATNVRADEFVPTKLTSLSFGSSISRETGDTFFAVLGTKDEGQGTRVVAYKGKEKLFDVAVSSTETVALCDANSNQQVLLKRSAANDACITSILSGKTGTVSDLSTVTSTSCNCFNDGTANKRYGINDSGTALEVTSEVDTDNNTNQITLTVYKNGGVTSTSVPANYAYGELRDAFISGNGIVSWLLDGFSGEAPQDPHLTIFSYDPSVPQFKSSTAITGAVASSTGFSLDAIRVNAATDEGLIVITELIKSDYSKHKRRIFEYKLANDSYTEISPTQANLRKNDYDTRNNVGDLLCSVAPKHRNVVKDGAVYISSVLANGDAYGNGFFLKHKHTAVNNPYCYTSQFKAVGTCAPLFSKEPLVDTRYGLRGDILATPTEEAQKLAQRECSFEVSLKKANKQPLKSTSVLLTNQFGSKAAIKIDSKGVGRFRVSVDPSNICNGPMIQGPYKNSDVHSLTKFAWVSRCL